MRIKEEIKGSGHFWLPSAPKKKLRGTLNISDGGKIELEVEGIFGETVEGQYSESNDKGEVERIVGQIEKYGSVTLDSCTYKNAPIFSDGFSKSLLYVRKVLLGIDYANRELLFSAFDFSVEGIHEWVGLSGIRVEKPAKEKAITTGITYSPLEEISLNLNNGMKLLIKFLMIPSGSPHMREAKITQRTYFKLVSQQERPIEDFLSVVHKVTTFLCFAIDKTVCINPITATSTISCRNLNTGESEPAPPISLYYESLPFTKDEPKIGWYHMLFRYQDIRKRAEQIINNWLHAYDKFEPALNLYFGVTTGELQYMDTKVLALAQGLESYHRRTADETLMDKGDFENLREILKAQCPEDHRKWLSEKLKYGNELSLRQRLQRIVEPLKEFIGDKSQQDKLIASIVDTRNYLTHYDESLKAKAASGEKLIHLYYKMEAIFQLRLLQELGFTQTEIKSVLDKSYRLRKKLEKV
ncbi:MAG: hypothetical protein OXL95_11475 [Nitrospira sp.]|nr:hypothetical protein [Nitrospira sp.]